MRSPFNRDNADHSDPPDDPDNAYDTDDTAVYIDENNLYVDRHGRPLDVVEEEVETDHNTIAGRFRRRGEPDPDAAEKKRRADLRRRKSRAMRDRGNAKRARLAVLGIALSFPISVMALFSSCGAPGQEEVNAAVDARLDEQGRGFPTGSAVMWTGQVLPTWANWDSSKAEQRATLLSGFLSQGMDEQAGWNGEGTQKVLMTSVNPEPRIVDSTHAFIDAAYMRDDGLWRCVSFKVFAYKPPTFSTTAQYAFALAGNPTPIGCSPSTGAPPMNERALGNNDQDAAENLRNSFFPGFFAAWASSDQSTLGQYLDDGVKTIGLGGAYLSSPPPEISDVKLPVPLDTPKGELPSSATAMVTLAWTLPDQTTKLTATYSVPMNRRGGQWFVAGEPTPTVQDADVSGAAPASKSGPSNGGNADAPQDGADVYPDKDITDAPEPTDIVPGGVDGAGQ